MKLLKITFILSVAALLTSCASGYRAIAPNSLHYRSNASDQGVVLEYKYELLEKKYKKKETKKDIRLAAIKITNNSGRDLVFGTDIKLTYGDGSELFIMETKKVYSSLKQSTASYLFYLLLTPLQLYKTESVNGVPTEITTVPIGLVIGPGVAGGNMIAASSANKKFKKDLQDNDLYGTTIKTGETVSGLIGIRTDDYPAINIKVTQ